VGMLESSACKASPWHAQAESKDNDRPAAEP